MSTPRHLLVFRFSAMGDVAMTVPVLKELLLQNPSLQLTVVSNGNYATFFSNIDRLTFFPLQLKGRHKGFFGLLKLYKELKALSPIDAVADLHNVVRTKILRSLFCFSPIKMAAIDKGRKEKKRLVQKNNKELKQLPTTFQRYATVFSKLGFQLILPDSIITFKQKSETLKIGIAPFAQHKEKMYPLEKMKLVIDELVRDGNAELFLFGARGEEAAFLEKLSASNHTIHNCAGKFSLQEEMKQIAALDLMVSMDSANMHIASLVGVPVISIWGSTHPYAGFLGWGQSIKNCVQTDLSCRPCSVFGNKPCYREDLACLHQITPADIVQRVKSLN